MNNLQIEQNYPVNKNYLISGFGCQDEIEKVTLISINGICAFIEYFERPLLHPVRYAEVTVFRLQKIN